MELNRKIRAVVHPSLSGVNLKSLDSGSVCYFGRVQLAVSFLPCEVVETLWSGHQDPMYAFY